MARFMLPWETLTKGFNPCHLLFLVVVLPGSVFGRKMEEPGDLMFSL